MSTSNIISISGGKDSLATALLAIERDAENIQMVFADTGNEHKLTYDYIEYLQGALDLPINRVSSNFDEQIAKKREYILENWAKDGVPEDHIKRAVEILKPTGNPFLDLCIWKGRFPSTRRRFCSQFLKHEPLDRFMRDNLLVYDEVYSWQGVRRDESPGRAKLAEEEDHPTEQGLIWYRPILDWKADDVFAIARKHGIDPNPLYKQGMGRVGCMPCIHATKGETFEIARRFPEELERLAEWESIVSMASKRGASTFFDARVTNRHLGLDPITKDNVHLVTPETHGVRVYIDWSKTARGGRQFDLLKEIEIESVPICKSQYGLCE
jgi:3'-phosphoadenosine 5'-phosphosulfate sulfotransferase (PAPS reductase)/FAD synthetase